ncbi:MAG: DUF192 domain-containing protein [Alphaproteobacteria bacterium]|nr:DUF192 domain-containing protein [Alphaproteobacteria bacterium]
MTKNKILLLALAAAAALALLLWATAVKGWPHARPVFAHAKLTVTRQDSKVFSYDVEVAQSLRQQIYGLMYVRKLPSDAGMIFPYDPPREVAFWMENTYIPLDMLFVKPDGTIGRIVTNAKPFDLAPIDSQINVSAVIEINAGDVARHGFTVGDRVASSALP